MTDESLKISRREFTALSLAAGLTAAARASSAATDMVDADVVIVTPSGSCDAALIHPSGKGPWPAVILFTDLFGLRPTMRDMAKRIAANGYTVLVPNPFYRTTKAPGLASTKLDFGSPEAKAEIAKLRDPLTNDAVISDTLAYVKFLDAQPMVNTHAKMGVFGYCMGGPMTMQAAAANPDRVGAGASFHGGGLVTDKPDSPHLMVPKMKAQFYFGVAMNDDARQPDAKTTLDQAFKAAHLQAQVEVYDGCVHGWCVKDMPNQPDGKPIYNEAGAERAWSDLVQLFKRVPV